MPEMAGAGPGGAALLWLACAAVLAGLVRGFSGFGTALVYVPLAALALPPLWVLVTMTVMDLVGPLPNVPRAWREANRREVATMALAAGAALLPGLWALDRLPAEGFRWLVAALCLVTVALMASGWRWSGRMGPGVVLGSGAMSGFLGGVSGLSGPPVILVYMSSPLPAAVIRANVLLYLIAWDLVFGGLLAATGRMEAAPLLIGAGLILPYMAANVVGARLFRPARDRTYRAVAYTVIAGAALMALPIWSWQ